MPQPIHMKMRDAAVGRRRRLLLAIAQQANVVGREHGNREVAEMMRRPGLGLLVERRLQDQMPRALLMRTKPLEVRRLLVSLKQPPHRPDMTGLDGQGGREPVRAALYSSMNCAEPGDSLSLTLPTFFRRAYSRTLPWRSTSCIRYGRSIFMDSLTRNRSMDCWALHPARRLATLQTLVDLEPRPYLPAVDHLRLRHTFIGDHLVEQGDTDTDVRGRRSAGETELDGRHNERSRRGTCE